MGIGLFGALFAYRCSLCVAFALCTFLHCVDALACRDVCFLSPTPLTRFLFLFPLPLSPFLFLLPSSSSSFLFPTMSAFRKTQATVPLLVNRALTYELGRKVTMGKARNYDLFDVLLNGIDPASEKIMGF